MGKKKKPAAAADAPPAESDDVSMEPDAGTVALQAADGMGGPAACVVLHWETLRRLGACLGDTLELCSPMGHPVLLGAWASARMPPGRAGLADEVREALGLVVAAFLLGTLGWMLVRTRHGLRPTFREEKKVQASTHKEHP